MKSCIVCPVHLLEVLELISSKLRDITDESMMTPFDNSGLHFKNDVFEVYAYDWSESYQPFNFKWKDIEISWYKYLGRMTTVNREVDVDETSELFNDCINSLINIKDGKIYNN